MLATVWGALAPTVADMIVSRPDLGRQLSLAPPWVIHSVAAYTEAMLADKLLPNEIAVAVESQHARDLLAEAVPDPHPRVVPMLGRLEPRVADLAFYRRLNRALGGPAAPLLLESETITNSVLTVAEQIAHDPVLLAARRVFATFPHYVGSLSAALAYVRGLGLADQIERLPPSAGWRSVLRRLKADLGRAPARPPPFTVPDRWRAIRTLDDLWEVGRAMENCVRNSGFGGDHHMIDLILGTTIFLANDATEGGTTMLAAIKRVGSSTWVVEQLQAKGSRAEFRERREALLSGLKQAASAIGHSMFESCPLGVLSAVRYRLEGVAGDEEEDDLDNVA